LSDMLSIYRGLWWYMCPSPDLVQLIAVKNCIEHFLYALELNQDKSAAVTGTGIAIKINYIHIQSCCTQGQLCHTA